MLCVTNISRIAWKNEQTQKKNRGIGTRHAISDDAPIPYNFKESFLHNIENKNDLNEYLAQKMVSLHTSPKLW